MPVFKKSFLVFLFPFFFVTPVSAKKPAPTICDELFISSCLREDQTDSTGTNISNDDYQEVAEIQIKDYLLWS
jgi:hypothetical protein